MHVLRATDHQMSTILGPDVIEIMTSHFGGTKSCFSFDYVVIVLPLSFWLIEGERLKVEMMLDILQLKF